VSESKRAEEASTVEGRLADLIEGGVVTVYVPNTESAYRLSDDDRTLIVKTLRDRARWMASDIYSGERPGPGKRQRR
jgi:hypothetical protein